MTITNSKRRTAATFLAGAALAGVLTVTGMQAWNAGAASTDDGAAFVPVAPCRLLDTRANSTQGERRAPLARGETFTAQVTGDNGDCVGIPDDASAVALNVTVLNPTARSFLTLYPADEATRPTVSNLNWLAGQAPTPNKVDVKVSSDGKIKIYNERGDVDVFIDIAGYYSGGRLDDLDERVAALESRVPRTVTISGLELRGDSGSSWGIEVGALHSPSAFAECAVAPLELALGERVTSVSLNYGAGGPVEFENTGVVGYITRAGSVAAEADLVDLVAEADVSAPAAGGAINTASIPIDGVAAATPGYAYFFQVCTTDSVEVVSMTAMIDNL